MLIALSLLIPAGLRPASVAAASTSGDDAAWGALRAQLPAAVPVYRPTWLPDRFAQVWQPVAPLPYVGVTYRSAGGELLAFTFGATNSAEPSSHEALTVHGQPAMLTTTASAPLIAVSWSEAGESYSVRGERGDGTTVISRDELLRVVAGLALVGPDGRAQGGVQAADEQCFPQTGHCVGGRFLAYWQAHGGLMLNGYPLSDELDQQLEDGKTYRVQYFERVRLEYHPENAAPDDVLLGQFGRHFHPADPPVAQLHLGGDETYFSATGHNLRDDFLRYWQANGGLAQFGYPLSEEIQERLEDGHTYTVQYFERARFERHDSNKAPYNVLLGQFGRRILVEQR